MLKFIRMLIDVTTFFVMKQLDAAWMELRYAYPSTFGRRVRVAGINGPGAGDLDHPHWTRIAFTVTPGDATPHTITIDVEVKQLVHCPSLSVNAQPSGGHLDGTNILGFVGWLLIQFIAWPGRAYYRLTEEYTGLYRNSRALLNKLRGQIPEETLAALKEGFHARRERDLGRA